MKLERFEVPGLAHYSYIVGSEGQAVVIDPKRDIDTYLDYAAKNNLRITHVLETHIHADYVSGTPQLVRATDAEAWMSSHDGGEEFAYRFPHHDFSDGAEVLAGDLRIEAVHTPGHTPEHLSFLVYERSRCGQPLALFSGDFIFVGSLGRPDLLGEEAKKKLAGALYDSVHERIVGLPDFVQVYPAHGAGSLCGAGMGERPQSTLGYERFCNIFMADREKSEFVETILDTVPEFPDYYRRMKRVNSDGAPVLNGLPGGELFSPRVFQEKRDRLDALVIDLRRPEAFGGAHIPGAFNIGAGQNLSMWAAWVVPYDRPILLVGDAGADLEAARRSLIRVGFDNLIGSLRGGMAAWIEAGLPQAHVPQISVTELAGRLDDAAPTVLDVRSPNEWKSGHIASAIHIPGGSLPGRVDEVPRNGPVHVICGSGYRSSIASSVLRRAGVPEVVNVVGGMGAWKAQNLPVGR